MTYQFSHTGQIISLNDILGCSKWKWIREHDNLQWISLVMIQNAPVKPDKMIQRYQLCLHHNSRLDHVNTCIFYKVFEDMLITKGIIIDDKTKYNPELSIKFRGNLAKNQFVFSLEKIK